MPDGAGRAHGRRGDLGPGDLSARVPAPWVDKSYVTQVALQPLTQSDSLRVVQAVLPPAAQTLPLVPLVLAKAEGNPFFLEELARAVVEQGVDVASLTVPGTVQAVLTARMDRLPTAAKRLLQAAAVIGKEVALPLLQAVTEASAEALQGAAVPAGAEFLYETYARTTPVYTFTHVLTQEVAYHSLVRRVRQHYHTRIAHVLEAQFPQSVETQPAVLARHYTEAGLAAPAIPYWQRAGQQALEHWANREAVQHLTTALALLATLPDTPARASRSWPCSLPSERHDGHYGPRGAGGGADLCPGAGVGRPGRRGAPGPADAVGPLAVVAKPGRYQRRGSWRNSSCGRRRGRATRRTACKRMTRSGRRCSSWGTTQRHGTSSRRRSPCATRRRSETRRCTMSRPRVCGAWSSGPTRCGAWAFPRRRRSGVRRRSPWPRSWPIL